MLCIVGGQLAFLEEENDVYLYFEDLLFFVTVAKIQVDEKDKANILFI